MNHNFVISINFPLNGEDDNGRFDLTSVFCLVCFYLFYFVDVMFCAAAAVAGEEE